MKVLVTGAGALLGQGILRSLSSSQLGVTAIAVDPSPLAAGLYWTPHHALIPLARSEAFLPAIEAILERERPDAVLVGTDVELGVLAEARARLEQKYGTHVVVSSPQVVGIADDKYETFRFMSAAGFMPPATVLPGRENELAREVGFPLIVKPRVGARSVGVHLVRTTEELARAVAEGGQVVIQECVGTPNDEYTAGTLTFDGRCDASIVMRRDLRDGNTYRAFVEPFESLNEQVRAMAVALGAYGPANFQFRLDAQGRVRVFEINGRFSGTTPLRMHAGFNEVEMVLRRVVLGEPIRQPRVEPVTVLRYWSETVIRNDQLVGA
jgi:carbamoyl-phosphate synthase large subunit